MNDWIDSYGDRPTGCLPRAFAPGTVCGMAMDKLDEVIPRSRWDEELAKMPGGVVDMEDCVGEYYDQNGFGSCAWESTTKAIEAASRLQGMTTSGLNPWFGYGIAVNWRGGPRVGTSIDENLQQAMRLGVASAEIWPRSEGPNRRPPEVVYTDALRYRPTEAFDCVNVAEVATCLLKRWPVVIGWNGHSELLIGLKPGGIVKVCGSYGSSYYNGKGWHDEDIDRIDFDYGAFAVRAVVDRKL